MLEPEGTLFDRGCETRRTWYAFFKDLIALRRKTPELTDGACRLVDPGEDAPARDRTVACFERILGRRLVRCAVNLGEEPRRLTRPPSIPVPPSSPFPRPLVPRLPPPARKPGMGWQDGIACGIVEA